MAVPCSPFPDLLASQLTAANGEALLSHIQQDRGVKGIGAGLGPAIEEGILALLCSGIFRFAPAMQREQPGIQKPCAPLAGEVFRPLWGTQCVMNN